MKDWEEGIHLLLFATREAIQHSGIQSFDLVFRHTVRGPLKLLYLAVLSVNLLQYVSDFALSLLEHAS